MQENLSNNKRIAKNTIVLYVRTIIILIISLYTSRIVLNTLGVEDYGIYNAVGGVVAMLNVISLALASAISRFITFELGSGNKERLKVIFSTSVNIQIGLAFIVLVIGELLGVWFLNSKMNIPVERMTAANWVYQCSLLSFCINMISVPYNACIIAHERMNAFAYVSILEAVLKLLVCYAIIVTPWDRLVVYAVLLVVIAIIIRLIYGFYCGHHFEECKYRFVFDKPIFKDMISFAGWNFFTNGAYVFNTQGVNLLINIFFGVTVNAARGIATHVEGAVMQLVNSFTTALNPQITKSYAAGEKESMLSLVFRGAKFSYYLLFIIALPIIVEADFILTLWLKNVPEHAVVFVQLSMVASLVNIVGKTGYTASMATGNIKRYVLWVTSAGVLAFPLTWVAFSLGAPSEATYIVFIVVYIIVEGVRLWVMKGLLDFPVRNFLKNVILRLLLVTGISCVIPFAIIHFMDSSWFRLFISLIACMLNSLLAIYVVGLTSGERQLILNVLKNRLRKF